MVRTNAPLIFWVGCFSKDWKMNCPTVVPEHLISFSVFNFNRFQSSSFGILREMHSLPFLSNLTLPSLSILVVTIRLMSKPSQLGRVGKARRYTNPLLRLRLYQTFPFLSFSPSVVMLATFALTNSFFSVAFFSSSSSRLCL